MKLYQKSLLRILMVLGYSYLVYYSFFNFGAFIGLILLLFGVFILLKTIQKDKLNNESTKN